MPLTLVTGPANAEKAREVLGRARELAVAGAEPMLVVPTSDDVHAYRAELAAGGVLLGLRIEQFQGLMDEIRGRAGLRARGAGAITRDQIARGAMAGLELGPMAASARTAGFAAALVALVGELARSGIGTGRFLAAMRAWAAAAPERGAYATDLGVVVAAYRDRLERLGRSEPADADRAAFDLLRVAPRAWGGTPVLLYGFDDFTAVQIDAIETLADHVGTEVVVSLPFEAGREAFLARATVHAELDQRATTRVAVPASDAAYADASRAALHQLERSVFEAAPARVAPGDAVELLEGGGERAELELVAERTRRLIAAGTAPQEIVIAVRDLVTAGPLVATVLDEAGIPFTLERRLTLGHTALGAGVVALLRAALPAGTAADVLRFLRTPGFVKRVGRVDDLERDLRVRGVRTADEAQTAWDALDVFPLDVITRVRRAARESVERLCAQLAAEAGRLFAAPQRDPGAGRGAARTLSADEARDAAALRVLLAALGELERLARDAPPLAPAARELAALLESVPVSIPGAAAPGHVVVTTPLAIRARRVDTLFLCRMQEDVFPDRGRPEPFLGDDERRAINAASGLRLAPHDDPLAAERQLFYSAVSRPMARLVLSWHTGDDDGEPRVRSPFVDAVLACLEPQPEPQTRLLGAIGWDSGADLSPRQRDVAAGAGAGSRVPVAVAVAPGLGRLTDPDVLDGLARQDGWSASALELWARCPVRWFAERHLAPQSLDPEAEPLGRGAVAHEVLERTYHALSGALTDERLPEAEALVIDGLRAAVRDRPLSVDPRREVAERHRLEADLLRYVTHAAGAGSAFVPQHFELRFGVHGADHPAIDVGDGLVLRGIIDRVDVSPDGREAIVIDYKGRAKLPSWTGWEADGRLQAGLYALVLRQLLPGVDVVGALLQPIGSDDLAPRGLLLAGSDTGRSDVKGVDRVTHDERDTAFEAVRRGAIRAVAQIRAGELEPRPDTCGHRDAGCVHPTLCRCAT